MVHLVRNVVQLIRNCFTEEMQYTLQIGCGTGKSLFRNETVNSSRIVARLRQLPGQSAGGFYHAVVYCRPGDTVEIRCGIIFNCFRIVTLGSQNTVVQGWDIAISYPDKASCLIVVQLSLRNLTENVQAVLDHRILQFPKPQVDGFHSPFRIGKEVILCQMKVTRKIYLYRQIENSTRKLRNLSLAHLLRLMVFLQGFINDCHTLVGFRLIQRGWHMIQNHSPGPAFGIDALAGNTDMVGIKIRQAAEGCIAVTAFAESHLFAW